MLTVFYANLEYGQFGSWVEFNKAHNLDEVSEEVWQGCFVYNHLTKSWWLTDQTPYLEDQIDPRLKAWLLLLD